MARLVSWFRSEEPKAGAPTAPEISSLSKEDLWAQEISNLEDAFSAANLILDDQMDLAESRLKSSPASSYHQLALAVISFIRSVLGFEREVMTLASAQLADCETRALADQRRVQKEFAACVGSGADASDRFGVYPPGTEYALVNAEAMLMGAVVGVLHESLADGIRSFYKLRKAYFALEAIVQMDVKGPALCPPGAAAPEKRKKSLAESFAEDRMPGSFGDDEFRDLDESQDGESRPKAVSERPRDTADVGDPDSHSLTTPRAPTSFTATSHPPSPSPSPCFSASASGPSTSTSSGSDPDVLTNPRDIFIHSGASMCFGTLLFILTLVPPALSRLLGIVGFHGDRPRGIRMLWESSAAPNVHGAIACVVLLSYYNGLLGLADILPPACLYDASAESVGPPLAKCEALLDRMRARYPSSGLWRIEQSRMHANARRLDLALDVLSDIPPSSMKQIDALAAFETAIDSMFAMRWAPMRDAFVRCLDLNEWSRTLYYFLAGCAEVELYRDAVRAGDAAEAGARKLAAEGWFAKAPGAATKRRLLAKPLPFEVFTLRKLKAWEARAKDLGVDLVDAVGVSPAQEMVYLWSGGRRLDDEQAERALGYLDWGRCTASADAVGRMRGAVAEDAVRGLCAAALLRVRGKVGEARAELVRILEHDR